MGRKFILISSGTAAACLLAAGIALSHSDDQEKQTLADQATVSIQEAIDVATAAFPGKVVEAELEDEDGRVLYEVEIVGESGETREFEIDAMTAKVLDNEHEDEDDHDRTSEHE